MNWAYQQNMVGRRHGGIARVGFPVVVFAMLATPWLRCPVVIPFAAIILLESAPQESCTGAHENLPHLPADLLR